MSARLSTVEEQALLLEPREREALVESLLQSLREEIPVEIRSAWVAEAEKRYREYKDGLVEGIPAERVFSELHQEFGWRS